MGSNDDLYGPSQAPPDERPLRAAVLFLVFNRPETTQQVFDAIRRARPSRLYVAGDGPREDVRSDRDQIALVRSIATNVDWPCEVSTLFRETNLGCKYAVSGAVSWGFESEDRLIILEDDCLPSSSFFGFCDEMLLRYQADSRVHHIGGTNPLNLSDDRVNSYGFSRYNRIWGWATWKNSWEAFNVEIPLWPEISKSRTLGQLLGRKEGKKYTKIFEATYGGHIDTWDYQWFLTRLLLGQAIFPHVNLVTNIGFGPGATHTKKVGSALDNALRGEMIFPLQHPNSLEIDTVADQRWAKMSSEKSWPERFVRRLGRELKRLGG